MTQTIWIIGGTTEGRCLAAALQGYDVHIYVSVATDYGKALMEDQENVTVLQGRLPKGEMEAFLRTKKPDLVIDGTHPYAQVVTENIHDACQKVGIEYMRIVRPKSDGKDYVSVHSMEEAVEMLSQTTGAIFLTTGSKDLQTFQSIPHYAERIALRILPAMDSLEKALSLGFLRERIVCMQGPFSEELNVAMYGHYNAKWIVTKDSGVRGGFLEKVAAAKTVGAKVVVISRPPENGLAYEAVLSMLQERFRHEYH